MKKLFLLAAVLLISITTFAQLRISGGPKLGLNLANVTNSDGGKIRPGVQIGGFLNLRFTDLFAFQPELLYSMQGTKFKGVDAVNYTGNTMDATAIFKLNYIHLPLMFKVYPINNFYLEAGPQFSVMFKSTITLKAGGSSASEDMDELMRKGDVGLGFGTGYETDLGLTLGIRYNIGLLGIFKDIDASDNSKNSVIQLALGWKF